MAAYRHVYDSRHLQADCQEPGLDPEPYARYSSMGYLFYCLNCTKFGKLILRKIIKIVATRCHILKLKCTKFDIVWGFAQDPAVRA